MGQNAAFLVIAVVCEVIATSALKETHGFTRLGPTVLTFVFYVLAFYFLSVPLKNMPLGVVYALWGGFGIVLITGIGWFVFRQALDAPALAGMGLIMAGVAVINLYSKTVQH